MCGLKSSGKAVWLAEGGWGSCWEKGAVVPEEVVTAPGPEAAGVGAAEAAGVPAAVAVPGMGVGAAESRSIGCPWLGTCCWDSLLLLLSTIKCVGGSVVRLMRLA